MQAVRTEQRPVAIDNYAAIRSTPAVLAAVLGSMAAATLAHLVVSVVRRRRRDLALCAALGMRRAQIVSAVVVQALLVAGAALVVGVPLGLAAGRLAWQAFASELGVVKALQLPFGTVALVPVVVGLVSMAVAAVPALVASRLRPALVLRAE
jgi:ABC-type antimicrobial peptide transport system permease subunit